MISLNRTSLVVILGAFGFLSPSFANTPSSPNTMSDITGKYSCNYHDPFSDPVDATEVLTLKKAGNTNYRMEKSGINDTTPSIVGIGFPNQDQNNVLSFLFWRPTDTATVFVQVILVKPDGTLDGKWAVGNKSQAATFTCKKSS